MNTNVNLEAAIGVLSFLGTAFVLGLALIILLHALKKGKRARAVKIGTAA
jgi:cbb3-type cytochrome oxidase subunit 3